MVGSPDGAQRTPGRHRCDRIRIPHSALLHSPSKTALDALMAGYKLCAPYKTALKSSAVRLADLAHSFLDPLGISVPERLERGLVEIGDVLAEIFHRLIERVGGGGLLGDFAQPGDDRLWRALGREHADPQIELDVVAELLHGRHLGQGGRALRTEAGEWPELAGFDLGACGRDRGHQDL